MVGTGDEKARLDPGHIVPGCRVAIVLSQVEAEVTAGPVSGYRQTKGIRSSMRIPPLRPGRGR